MHRKPIKAKIKCAGIFSCACSPVAVITATTRGQTYVHMDYDTRAALTHSLNVSPAGVDFNNVTRLVRGHRIDAESGDVAADFEAPGYWSNCEDLWLRVDLAAMTARVLRNWQAANPRESDRIWAPNHNVLRGVRMLAIAAGRIDPGPDGASVAWIAESPASGPVKCPDCGQPAQHDGQCHEDMR